MDKGLGYGTDEEILRVLKMFNDPGVNWIPAKQNGCYVRYKFIMPIYLKLADSEG